MYKEAFKYKDNRTIVDNLFKISTSRITRLVNLLRRVSHESFSDSEMVDNYKDRVRYITSKYNKLQNEFSELKIELEDKNDLC